MKLVRFKTIRDDSDMLLQYAKLGKGVYLFLELMYWEAYDSSCEHTYCCSLDIVDLLSIPKSTVASAWESCGFDQEGWDNFKEVHQAEALRDHGATAPIWSKNGNNKDVLMKTARSEAQELLDPESYESAMQTVVNGVGSTAREFMQGDIFSGMTRGIVRGDEKARLIGKMYGASEEKMDEMRKLAVEPMHIGPHVETFSAQVDQRKARAAMDDPLPFYMGFSEAMSGKGANNDPDIADSYLEGYRLGLEVKLGKAETPEWIKNVRLRA